MTARRLVCTAQSRHNVPTVLHHSVAAEGVAHQRTAGRQPILLHRAQGPVHPQEHRCPRLRQEPPTKKLRAHWHIERLNIASSVCSCGVVTAGFDT